MIIITEKKFFEASDPTHASIGVEGYYTLRARRRSGRVTRDHTFKADREVGPFHNLVTTLGMDRLGSESAQNVYARCHVGTGTSAPSIADVQLANFLASLQNNTGSDTSGNSASSPYYGWRRIVWTSAVGALGNSILTEVGISGQQADGLLFSRELIRDSVGNPTSFPISDDEQLEVTYELRFYVPLADSTGQITINSQTYDVTTRARSATSNSWAPRSGSSVNFEASGRTTNPNHILYTAGINADITANEPSGGARNGQATGLTTSAYGTGNFYRDMTQSFGPAVGIGDNLSCTFTGYPAHFQTGFSPAITKTDTQTLILHHRVSWARR